MHIQESSISIARCMLHVFGSVIVKDNRMISMDLLRDVHMSLICGTDMIHCAKRGVSFKNLHYTLSKQVAL